MSTASPRAGAGGDPAPPPGAASSSRRTPWAPLGSLLVAAAAVVVLVGLGSRQTVSYDSFWHVFIARPDTWKSFWREVRANAHPPLYFVLLKLAIVVFGNAILAYRAVSIAAVAAAILSFGRIAGRLTANPLLAFAGTVAFGLSASLVEIGLEVRSYALLLAFMLPALHAYVRWLEDGEDARGAEARFAAFASLALLSHYSAFFFLGATLVAPAILAAADPRWRERIRRRLSRNRLAGAAMFGVPLATGALAFRLHVRLYPDGFGHVLSFLRDGAAESVLAFAVRNTRSLALLFLPGRWEDHSAAAVAALAGFLLLAWAALRKEERAGSGVVPFVLLFAMVGANLIAGLARRYPYGGFMRHEIFIFPVLVLCVIVGIEAVRRGVRGRWAHRGAWSGAALAAIVACVALGLGRFPLDPITAGEVERFRGRFPEVPAVLVDQYNSIRLFSLHHDWSWHLVEEWPGRPGVWQVWSVSSGAERFHVCRDGEWLLDFTKPSLYGDVADCLAATSAPSVAVYRPQMWGARPPWDVAETAALARSLSGASGVEPAAVLVDGDDVYASFARAPSPGGSRVR